MVTADYLLSAGDILSQNAAIFSLLKIRSSFISKEFPPNKKTEYAPHQKGPGTGCPVGRLLGDPILVRFTYLFLARIALFSIQSEIGITIIAFFYF